MKKYLVVIEALIIFIGITLATPLIYNELRDESEIDDSRYISVDTGYDNQMRFDAQDNIILLTGSVIQKISLDGSLLWTKNFISTVNPGANRLVIDRDNDIIVSGIDVNGGNNDTGVDYDIGLMKYSTNGETLWQKILGGRGEDHIWDMTTDSEGNIYAVGMSWSPDFPVLNAAYPEHKLKLIDGYYVIPDGIILKFDKFGKLLWSTFFGGDEYDIIESVNIVGERLVISGYSSSQLPLLDSSPQQEYSFIAKFSLDGVHLSTDIIRYGGNALRIDNFFWEDNGLYGNSLQNLYLIEENGSASLLYSIQSTDFTELNYVNNMLFYQESKKQSDGGHKVVIKSVDIQEKREEKLLEFLASEDTDILVITYKQDYLFILGHSNYDLKVSELNIPRGGFLLWYRITSMN